MQRKFIFFLAVSLLAYGFCLSQDVRFRVHDIGLTIGVFKSGTFNAITDVTGVKVGHTTIIEGENTRTGVTAIVPHEENIFKEKVPAAVVVGNGFGKLIGSTQVEELGELETPIILTNTLSVWIAADALAEYMISLPNNELVRSINPVVGETNDGVLNDIRGRHVKKEHVMDALNSVRGAQVEEGSVGAGTGTVCFGWKGGIGTSSRILPPSLGGYTIGVLVQTNYGGMLEIAGVPIGKELGKFPWQDKLKYNDGSCMIIVATDAPLGSHELKRLARRAPLALGKTGSSMNHGSGDYVIAFSTAKSVRIYADSSGLYRQNILRQDQLSPLFQAVVEATEEAIYNSLFRAVTMIGKDGITVDALPLKEVIMLLKKYKKIE
ncbi:MAG TPA: P1 family peptidase [Bacteroidota bacterium]|nr:P1 family peptidase [Bacteroidota bacterium]